MIETQALSKVLSSSLLGGPTDPAHVAACRGLSWQAAQQEATSDPSDDDFRDGGIARIGMVRSDVLLRYDSYNVCIIL